MGLACLPGMVARKAGVVEIEACALAPLSVGAMQQGIWALVEVAGTGCKFVAMSTGQTR